MVKRTFSKKIQLEYCELLSDVSINPSAQKYVNASASKAIKNKKKYLSVSKVTGVPWTFIAAIHARESGMDFRGVLHNGERIIGTGKKTRLVPKGKGPFSSWEEAAIHSLKYKKLHLIKDWTPERICYEFERYNGWGYRIRGHSGRSPYLWAATNHQLIGKYVSDGKYSNTTMDKQLGAVAVWMRINQLDRPNKEIAKSSRRLTFIRIIQRGVEWLSGLSIMGVSANISSFATDWKTLTILAVVAISAFMIWFIARLLEIHSIKEYKEGRYEPSGESNLVVFKEGEEHAWI